MPHLTRTDPEANTNRFYNLTLAPTLFNGWSVVREWGRIGQGGTVKIDQFDTEEAAQTRMDWLKRQKLKKGYKLN